MGEDYRAGGPTGDFDAEIIRPAVAKAVGHGFADGPGPLLRRAQGEEACYATHPASLVRVASRMVKVLVLAYDFPPFVSVGGLRPYSWFRYLGEFGVEPVVVTRQWANHYQDERDYIAPSATTKVEVETSSLGTILRTPYAPNLSNRILLAKGPNKLRLVRRLITAWYEVGQYYAAIGPKVGLYRAARRYLQQNHQVDAIVATGEPFVLFKYAARLSKEFGIPWVADYRDPWSLDKRRIGIRISRRWEAGLERRFTASASAIITVSGFLGGLLTQLHGRTPAILPNGYDPESMAGALGCEQGHEKFTVAFTGSIYGWHPIESVFRVFQEFVRARPEAAIALDMIGVGRSAALEELLRSTFPDLVGQVRFSSRLPNNQMAMQLAKANAFLMFNNYAYAGTKVFDYMALRRRIILCYSADPEAKLLKDAHYNLEVGADADQGILERMVEETKSGVVVRDAAHLRQVLTDFYREFKSNGGLTCEPVGIEKYSRRSQVEQLAGLLKGLTR